jgi:hypothetical protein
MRVDSLPIESSRLDPDPTLSAALLSTADRFDPYAKKAGCLKNGLSFRNLPPTAGGLKNHLMHLHGSPPVPRMIIPPRAFFPRNLYRNNCDIVSPSFSLP